MRHGNEHIVKDSSDIMLIIITSFEDDWEVKSQIFKSIQVDDLQNWLKIQQFSVLLFIKCLLDGF